MNHSGYQATRAHSQNYRCGHRVDTALKIAPIREAKSTLDIASYDERCDAEFTRPVLAADYADRLYDDALLDIGHSLTVKHVAKEYRWLKNLRGLIPQAILRSM